MFSYFPWWWCYHLKVSNNIYWCVLLLVLLFSNTLQSALHLQVVQLYWCHVVLLFTFFGLGYQIHAKPLKKKKRLLGYKFCPLELVQVTLNSLVLFDISYIHGKAISKHKFPLLRRAACNYRLAEDKPGKLTVQGCADKGMSHPVYWLPECS